MHIRREGLENDKEALWDAESKD